MSSTTFLRCPRCGQVDSVRKVTSVVQDGISVGSYQSTVPLQIQGKTIQIPSQHGTIIASVLARRLMPPEQPPEPKKRVRT